MCEERRNKMEQKSEEIMVKTFPKPMQVLKPQNSRDPINTKLDKLQRKPHLGVTVKLIKFPTQGENLKSRERGKNKGFFKEVAGRLTDD